jgi:hypothetical protein
LPKKDGAMKFTLAFAATAALLLATPLQAQPSPGDPAAQGYAREIVNTMLPPERRREITDVLMHSMMDQIRNSALGRGSDPGLRQLVNNYVTRLPERLRPVNDKHLPLIMDSMVRAYVREFSADELKQISEFAKTPSGAHYLSRNIALLSEPTVAVANQAYFQEAARVAQASTPERAALEDYLKKHPEVARQIQAQPQPQAKRR